MQDFANSIERGRKWKFCLGKLRPFNVFVILKTALYMRELIKIVLARVHIKPEVKKKT